MYSKSNEAFFKQVRRSSFLTEHIILNSSPRLRRVMKDNRLRSIDDLIVYKSKNSGFDSLMGAGPRTQMEIEGLISKYLQSDSTQDTKLNKDHIVSVRAFNAMKKICNSNNPDAVTFFQASYKFDRDTGKFLPICYHEIIGIGYKTGAELNKHRSRLESALKSRFKKLFVKT